MDSCAATERVASRMFICERPLSHDGDHRDGDVTWKGEKVRDDSRVIGERGEER